LREERTCFTLAAVRLTARRRAILKDLVEKPYLTSTDFYALCPQQSSRGLRRALRDFARLGYLRRNPLPEDEPVDGAPLRWEYVYWLSEKGLDLARRAGLDPRGLGLASDEKSPYMLPHDHAVTAFHLTLDRAIGEEVWWRQGELKHTFEVGRQSYTVNADALFYVGGYYYFLEIERSKQGHYRSGESGLMKKVRGYVEYARSGSYRLRWPEMRGFFLLVVVESTTRQTNLLEILRVRYPQPLLRVTTVDAYRADLLGAIWQSPKDCHEGKVHSLRTEVQVRP